jgi:iron complex transport system substrate-binding protein
LLLLAAGPAKTFAAETRAVTDAHGRAVAVGMAGRIVSIGGAVTEILFALGLGDRVVGIDLTSTYPPAARALPQVGYMRALSPEGVLSLAPDLVVAVEGSGPPDAIEVLERASVPFVLVPEAYDAGSAVKKIRFIADLLGVREKGEAVVAALQADLGALEGIRASIAERRKAIFVLGLSTGAPLVAGEHTAANGIFALAGVDNALSGFSGYRPASDEAAMGAAPDAVVIMAERGHQLTPEVVFAAPAFAGTPAARDGRLVALSGSYMLNFGPRTAHAARDLIAAVYPELAVPDLPARPWTAAAAH